jgi:hypothetical protein
LPDTLKENSGDPFDPTRTKLRLRPRSGGGFRLEAAGGWWLESGPVGEARAPLVSSDRRGWTLRGSEDDGLVLEAAVAEGYRELGRSFRVFGTGLDPWAFYLGDGRIFFAAPSIGAAPELELHGWEARGAYWTATRHESHWRLAPTAAGRRLDGAEPILVLFAARILDIEPWRCA